MQGQHGHLSLEQKQWAFRLRARGWRLADIAREIGCTAPMVGLMVRDGLHRDAKPFGWEPRAGCLTVRERERILLGIGRGESLSAIGRSLGQAPATGASLMGRDPGLASSLPPRPGGRRGGDRR